MNKRLKTPLRWCGGKSRAIYKMEKYNPNMDTITEFRDAFLGGGSYPIYLSQLYPNINIWVNNLYTPLFTFWTMLKERGEELISILLDKRRENNTIDLAKILFLESKKDINNPDPMKMAVSFYILNKCGYSGLMLNPSFSKGSSVKNFKECIIKNLAYYIPIIQRWKITNMDYKELLKDCGENTMVYLDPPYNIKSQIYTNHKSFNHLEFKKSM